MDDRIEVRQDEWKRILLVKGLRDKPLPRIQACTLYEELSPPRPSPERADLFLPELREKGRGRPTKRERREIERLKKS